MTATTPTGIVARARALALAAVFAVTGLGIVAAPVEVPRPAGLAPEPALAYACADGPNLQGWLTDSTSSHPNITISRTGLVYAWISDVVDDWSCTAFYRYDGVMWALSATNGNFAWGNLINSTSVSCNWAIGSNDYIKANSTSDCPDTDAEYAYLIHLGETSPTTLFEGTLNEDVSPDARGDTAFIHSDCEDYYGAASVKWDQPFGTSDGPRPSGGMTGDNCDPYALDGFNTNISLTVDGTPPKATGLVIASGAAATSSTSVSLGGITGTDNVSGVAEMRFSNNGTAWSAWEPYAATRPAAWDLTSAAYGGTSADGAKTVHVQLRDANGNGPSSESISDTITLDRAGPTASFSATPSTPTNATTLAYTVHFSEGVTGLAAGDFTVGGSATGWSVTVNAPTGNDYPVRLTGGTSGTVTLALAANGVTDAVGNTGPAAATAAPTVTVDRTAPTATFSTSPSTPTSATSLTYTVTFSEAVTGLTASDFTRTGSATGWSVSVGSPTGNAYPITATGGTSGTLTLTLAAGAVADAVGNAGPATAISAPVVTIDRTAPTASYSTTPTTPTNATPLAYGVTFSEPVTGVAGSDFTIGGSATGWTLGAVSGSGAGPYTFSLTGGTAGTVTLALAANSVTDGVNTGPTTATSAPVVTVDRTAPSGTVSINSSALYTTSATVTLTVSATDAGSPPVSQMRFSNDGSTWTTYAYTTSKPWTLAGGTDGPRIVYAQFLDSAGNWNIGTALSDTITLDTTDPVSAIAISGGAPTTASPSVVLSVTASDATSGVALTQASNDNATFVTVSGATPGWTLTSGDGIKTVWYRVTDASGRVTTASDTISLITEWVPGSASSIVVPYQATGWKYQQVAQGGITGFEASDFDDTAWDAGTGAFASGGGCAIQSNGSINTAWSTGTDMLVRRHVALSPGTTGVQVWVAIDNDITAIYWNGVQIGGPSTHENCPTLDNRAFSVSPGLVTADNVLAIRARDRGIEAYFDARVLTGGMPIEPAVDGTTYLENGATAGDPVQTFSGAFTYSHTDVAIAGRGPSPVFTRSYSSADTRVGPLGPGWTDSYYMRLREPGDGSGDILLVRADGNTDRFTRNNDETFSPSPATYATLVRNPDLSYTVSELSGQHYSFDAGGKLTAIIDRYGNTASLGYDGSGRLASVADPAGRGSLTLAYTGNRLTSVTDWMTPARTVTYGYDAQGRLQSVIDREGKTTSYGYDGLTSRITTITDARGHVALTLTYDSQGRVATQKDAQGLTTGATTTFSYVVNGDGTRVTTTTRPPTSFDTSFSPTTIDTYTAQGWITQRVAHPSSSETLTESYTYDAVGNRSSVTDARGNRTDYCYDVSYTGAAVSNSRGNLTRIIGPSPTAGAARPVTLLKYDAKNNLIQQVSPRGVPSTSTTTCTTNLSATTLSYVTDYVFDGTATQLRSMTQRFTDPDLGSQTAVTKYEYDLANPGLVSRVIPPRRNTGGSPDYSSATTTTYYTTGSRAGLPQQQTDALGNTTTYDYDPVGRMTSTVDQLGNAAGGVPADHRTEYVYDNEDRTRFLKGPAPTAGGAQLVTETRYDAVGNPVVRIDAAGQVSTYAYDARDALLQVRESPNAWTDPASPPASVITTEYAYDAAGMLTRVTRAKGDSASERVTDYVYDGRNLVRSETQYPSWPSTSGALVTSSTFDAAGNLATTVDPLGRTTTYGYDPLNRRTSIDYSDPGTPDVGYAYDANGNRTTMADGTGTTTYVPDELGRPTSITSPGPTTVGYRYDLDGQRRKLIYPDASARSRTPSMRRGGWPVSRTGRAARSATPTSPTAPRRPRRTLTARSRPTPTTTPGARPGSPTRWARRSWAPTPTRSTRWAT